MKWIDRTNRDISCCKKIVVIGMIVFVLSLIDLAPVFAAAPTMPVEENLVLIPGGEFEMGNHHSDKYGDKDELPLHTVRLDSFHMGKYEVTNQEYCEGLNYALEGIHSTRVAERGRAPSTFSNNSTLGLRIVRFAR